MWTASDATTPNPSSAAAVWKPTTAVGAATQAGRLGSRSRRSGCVRPRRYAPRCARVTRPWSVCHRAALRRHSPLVQFRRSSDPVTATKRAREQPRVAIEIHARERDSIAVAGRLDPHPRSVDSTDALWINPHRLTCRDRSATLEPSAVDWRSNHAASSPRSRGSRSKEGAEEGGAFGFEHAAVDLGAVVEAGVSHHVPQRANRAGLGLPRTENEGSDAG